MTDALNNLTKYQYDAVGSLITLTDANGNATNYFYDAVNRPIRETYADVLSRNFTYDNVGNLSTRTDQKGQTTTYTYNDLYFLLGRTYPSVVNDTFTYDLSGRMLTAQRGTWPVTFTHDGGNRVTQTTQNGHLIEDDRILTLTHNPGGFADFSYTYDHEGNKNYELKTHDPAHSECYAYDTTNRLTSYKVGTVPTCTVPVTQTAYNLDPVGNLCKATDTCQFNSTNEEIKLNFNRYFLRCQWQSDQRRILFLHLR
jgi:YD repeat-containing protein